MTLEPDALFTSRALTRMREAWGDIVKVMRADRQWECAVVAMNCQPAEVNKLGDRVEVVIHAQSQVDLDSLREPVNRYETEHAIEQVTRMRYRIRIVMAPNAAQGANHDD